MPSTTPVTSWAVDLSTLGPIYPFVGWEFAMFIAGLAFWVLWHIWQLGHEAKTYAEELPKMKNPETLERAIREQPMEIVRRNP